MGKVNNIQDWLDNHIGGDCNEASDCMILLAQVIQAELTDLQPSDSNSPQSDANAPSVNSNKEKD